MASPRVRALGSEQGWIPPGETAPLLNQCWWWNLFRPLDDGKPDTGPTGPTGPTGNHVSVCFLASAAVFGEVGWIFLVRTFDVCVGVKVRASARARPRLSRVTVPSALACRLTQEQEHLF